MSIAKLAWIGLAAAFLVAGVAVATSVQDKTVQITEKGYVPDRIEVAVGQKLIFQNDTRKNHTVTYQKPAGEAQDKDKEKDQEKDKEKDKTAFDSGVIQPGTSWSTTFTKEGTYNYFCKEDKTMIGTIIVTPAK